MRGDGQTGQGHAEQASGRALARATDRARDWGIVLTQADVVQFLLRSAVEYEVTFCTIEGCEVCDEFCLTWDATYTALAPDWQRLVDDKLRRGEITRPRVPGEGW